MLTGRRNSIFKVSKMGMCLPNVKASVSENNGMRIGTEGDEVREKMGSV